MLRLIGISVFSVSLLFGQNVDYIQDIKNKPIFDTRQYKFTRTNGKSASGDLSVAGTNRVVTLTSCPKGLLVGNAVYISGGTGIAENVTITSAATTCTVAGGTNGTISINTSNTHTGSWVIGNATAGIQEAVNVAAAAGGGTVIVPYGVGTSYVALNIPETVTVHHNERVAGAGSVAAWVNEWARTGSADARSFIGSIYQVAETQQIGHLFSLGPEGDYFQGNALVGYARANTNTKLPVGGLFIGHTTANGGGSFGFNAIAASDTAVAPVLRGGEIDVEFSAGQTAGPGTAGLYLNIFSAPNAGPAIQTGGVGGGTWENGLILYGLAPTAAGVAPGSGATMATLLNSGSATYTDDAIRLEQGHGISLSGLPGHVSGRIAMSGDVFTVNPGLSSAFALLNSTGSGRGIIQVGRLEIGDGIVTPIQYTTSIGSPEGVVTAPPGSLCTNLSGGAGTTLYVKETGVGNTGWVAK